MFFHRLSWRIFQFKPFHLDAAHGAYPGARETNGRAGGRTTQSAWQMSNRWAARFRKHSLKTFGSAAEKNARANGKRLISQLACGARHEKSRVLLSARGRARPGGGRPYPSGARLGAAARRWRHRRSTGALASAPSWPGHQWPAWPVPSEPATCCGGARWAPASLGQPGAASLGRRSAPSSGRH